MFVLFTDFGMADPYVGQMHAVLAVRAPVVPIVDLFHEVPPGDVEAGAILLGALAPRMPENAVFVCVVDPGVGGPRWPVALRAGKRWFVGPDNGLLGAVALSASTPSWFRIRDRTYGVPSATFHGRDIFAPAAADLSLGRSDHLEPVADPASLETSRVHGRLPSDTGRVVYIDRFGNLFTDLGQPSASARIAVGDVRVGHAERFGAVARGELLWYVNSCGLVEVAANGASAARILGAGVGDPVRVDRP